MNYINSLIKLMTDVIISVLAATTIDEKNTIEDRQFKAYFLGGEFETQKSID